MAAPQVQATPSASARAPQAAEEPSAAPASSCPAAGSTAPVSGAFAARTAAAVSNGPADRMMRRLLGIRTVDRRSGRGAHRAFRISVLISAFRCTITYVAIPVLIPLLSLAGWVAAPVGIALCVIAAINGVISVRRFWRADHPQRWTYTAFIAVVFVILTISTITELGRLGVL